MSPSELWRPGLSLFNYFFVLVSARSRDQESIELLELVLEEEDQKPDGRRQQNKSLRARSVMTGRAGDVRGLSRTDFGRAAARRSFACAVTGLASFESL